MKRETSARLRVGVRRLTRWATQHRVGRKLQVCLLLGTLAAGMATYMAFTGIPPFGAGVNSVLLMLYVDLVLGLLLGAVVAYRLAGIWAQRAKGSAGARLHVRLVVMFSIVAVTPTVIVAFFSAAFFFQVGIQSWFNQQVATAVRNSVLTAESYLSEHKSNIRADALAMANDLNTEAARLMASPVRFNQTVAAQALFRNLTEAIVIDGSATVLARSTYSFGLEFERFPPEAIEQARGGDVAMLVADEEDRVRAIVRLERFRRLPDRRAPGRTRRCCPISSRPARQPRNTSSFAARGPISRSPSR